MSIIRYADVLARPIGEGVDLDTTILDWIQQQIEIANDGIIRVRIVDLRKVLGPNCEEKTDSNIYMGLRNALKKYGIDVRLGSYRYDSKVLIISNIDSNKVDK